MLCTNGRKCTAFRRKSYIKVAFVLDQVAYLTKKKQGD